MELTAKRKEYFFIGFCMLLSIAVRVALSFRGYNFDVESYDIVGKLVDKGANVYASTTRYNYGPIWFYCLGFFYKITSGFDNSFELFRGLISIFLSIVDIGIFLILYKKYGKLIGLLFLFNPVSIIISGYHSQFDNFAILVAMVSMIILGDSLDKKLNKKQLIALVVLGISITIKHIFFMFPFWLALKAKNKRDKLMVLIIPEIIFALGFLPYLKEGYQGILNNVFLYKSMNNAPFYRMFMIPLVQHFISPTVFFLGVVFIAGILLRKKIPFDSMLWYLCVLVIFSSAIANQYLAIIIPFISVYMNVFWAMYTVIAGYYLTSHSDGLHVSLPFGNRIHYGHLILVLFLGLIWNVYKDKICNYATNTITKFQAVFTK